jgi:hypothetical protein
MSKYLDRRSIVAFVAGIVLLVVFSGLAMGASSLASSVTVDISGLPLNLVLPLVNNTDLSIVRFILTVRTVGDASSLPTFYVVAVQILGSTEDAESESGDLTGADFDVDDGRDGWRDDDNYSYDRGNVVWLRNWSGNGVLPGQSFQLRMRGDSGSSAVFPPGTTLTILPLDARGAVILQIH